MKKHLLILAALFVVLSLVGGLAFADSDKDGDKKAKPGKVQEMTLYHDNPEFQDFWVSFGEASGEDGPDRKFLRTALLPDRPRASQRLDSSGSRDSLPDQMLSTGSH